MTNELQRFQSHTAASTVRLGPDGLACLEWTAARDPKGYGLFRRSRPDGRMVRAHRFAFEASVGPIPVGMMLDHLCRNPSCVLPAHLEPVTNRENQMRADTVTSRNARKTACHRGHPFSPENTGRQLSGRRCRLCAAEATARWRRNKKEASWAG